MPDDRFAKLVSPIRGRGGDVRETMGGQGIQPVARDPALNANGLTVWKGLCGDGILTASALTGAFT